VTSPDDAPLANAVAAALKRPRDKTGQEIDAAEHEYEYEDEDNGNDSIPSDDDVDEPSPDDSKD